MRFRKIEPRIYADAKFRGLSRPEANAQDLWIDLLISGRDRTIPGLVSATVAELAAVRRWELDATDKALAELERAGMLEADREAGLIWIRNRILGDAPRSPDNVKAWGGPNWAEVPECGLKSRAWNQTRAYFESRGEKFLEAFQAFVEKPFEKREARRPHPLPIDESRVEEIPDDSRDPVELIFETYKEIAVSGGFSETTLDRSNRWKILRVSNMANGAEFDRTPADFADYFREAVKARDESPWMQDRKLGLDFLVKDDERIRQVREGRYSGSKKEKKETSPDYLGEAAAELERIKKRRAS